MPTFFCFYLFIYSLKLSGTAENTATSFTIDYLCTSLFCPENFIKMKNKRRKGCQNDHSQYQALR